ncbi:MAG: hypothetical protein ACK559_37200, partial [bacterium]
MPDLDAPSGLCLCHAVLRAPYGSKVRSKRDSAGAIDGWAVSGSAEPFNNTGGIRGDRGRVRGAGSARPWEDSRRQRPGLRPRDRVGSTIRPELTGNRPRQPSQALPWT